MSLRHAMCQACLLSIQHNAVEKHMMCVCMPECVYVANYARILYLCNAYMY
jgi:hypothetical protein